MPPKCLGLIKMEAPLPKTAMVLAAGLGTRMRAGADDPPKPLRQVGGQTLLGRLLNELAAAGIEDIIVNVHHKADHIEAFLSHWQHDGVRVQISDERDLRLETGGGVKKALALLPQTEFFVCNADIVWVGLAQQLPRLVAAYRAAQAQSDIDACLLLAALGNTLGYDGTGDFVSDDDGRLRRGAGAYVYTGLQLLNARAVSALPEGAVSLNHLFDDAIAHNRLFGHVMNGPWIHVGTPEALAAAEAYLSAQT